MKSWQVILVLGVLGMGIVSGLAYGWLISPVEYVNTTPDTLRIDYKTDIVLMIAEIYAVELDLVAAMERLSLTGNSDIKGQVADSLEYARHMNFTDQDIDIIGDLFDALDDFFKGERQLP